MMNIIIWLLTAVLYSPVFYILYKSKWESVDYTHAYFTLPISLLIVFFKLRSRINTNEKARINTNLEQKDTNEKARISTNSKARIDTNEKARIDTNLTRIYTNGGVFLVIISLLLFILGWRNDYLFIQTFSLIPLLLGMTCYLYGFKVTRLLLFPILYLLLLVPPPLGMLDGITLPMRYGSSVASAMILKALHYPVTREGLLLTIGGHELYMGAPCSGFRSLITMFSLGLVYVYFIQGRLLKNLILIFSIIPLALVGNLIRIITLCLITYYYGEKVGQGFFHNFSGIIVFMVMILGLIFLENKIEGKRIKEKE
ncbi:MAG: exosortase/archaeosortase family protein [Candidatus Omnitrophica bacterium]|nr:exosortase/archaeosortase family protein [Candidatus Omnitrophota bacterium]